MAMLQMQRIFIYALNKDRKPLLEMLQRRGVVEISDEIPEDNVFQKTDTSYAKSDIEKNINTCRDAITILDHYVPVNKSMLSMLNGRTNISTEDYAAFREKYEQTVRNANRIITCNKAIAEHKADILRLEVQVEMLTPWVALDIPMNFSGTKSTKSYIGTIPKQVTLDDIYGKLAEYMPVNVDIISSSKEQTCIFVLCTKDKSEVVYEALREIEFAHPGMITERAPSEQLIIIKGQIEEAYRAIDVAEKEIIDLAAGREDILFLQDYDKMRFDKYEVIGQLLQSKNVFLMTGFIAARDAKKLEEELTKHFEAAVEFEEPDEDEEVPVKLKNNGFAAPLEWVVEGFSLPVKGEIDPTMMMAVFYYLLFGIIMADAGYGLLMVAACGGLLLKGHKTMEPFMKNFMTMFFYCGISSVIWGVAFGSYFGDLIDVVAVNYFGAQNTPIIPPLWFFPINKPMQMLTFSMALGIVHLLTGLVVKAYQLIRQKDYIAILYDSVSWFILILSCTVILCSMAMIQSILGVSMEIPKSIINLCAIAAGICSVIIIATNGRESRNPFKRFLKGLYALYGISGYLGDVLSYSRLLALGLAAGVISSVVNKMAAMVGGGVVGPILFLMIVLFGHTLNFAISVLGAYVHTNRLQYVEFFGKFYGGGGRAFQPFNMNTKYYKIKENVKNEI
jgi:V/A-type H+-transporting ATPase subunit I